MGSTHTSILKVSGERDVHLVSSGFGDTGDFDFFVCWFLCIFLNSLPFFFFLNLSLSKGGSRDRAFLHVGVGWSLRAGR